MKIHGLLLAAGLMVALAKPSLGVSQNEGASSSAILSPGPVIEGFGPAAAVDDIQVGPHSRFKVAFDVARPAGEGQLNTGLESVARFLNMHAKLGVPPENMSLAVVVHGAAAMDLVTDERLGGVNTNARLVAALIDAGVTIQLCGQTAAFRSIKQTDLLPGVQMSLSAMTAHALLQREGYTLNPF